jgi:hypothetical protein
MDRRTFAVERLCVGDWPRTDGLVNIVISQERWAELVDEVSAPRDPVVFTLDITPDRRRSAIAVAGKRTDELLHVEIVEHRAGTGWVVERLVELVAKHQPLAVLCDGVSPAASLVRELKQAGIEIQTLDGRQHAQACGMFYDAVEQGKLRHLGTPELAAAIRGAAQRPLGDAWAWSRKNSQTDISPLVACTLGVWGVVSLDAARPLVAFA